jgi:hypothetical protein
MFQYNVEYNISHNSHPTSAAQTYKKELSEFSSPHTPFPTHVKLKESYSPTLKLQNRKLAMASIQK